MLFLPVAALCCLYPALASKAARLFQEPLTVTKTADQGASIECTGYEICDTEFVYWYQKKDQENFVRILRFDLNKEQSKYYGALTGKTFSALRKKGIELIINGATKAHSATYYCVCEKSVGGSADKKYLIFGTGTKLNITDDKAKPPKVSLYSVAPELQQEGKQPLLCVASGMFPTDVQFSWKRKKAGSQEEPLPDEEQLEIKESDRIASLRLVDRDPDSPYNYTCNVKHELKTEDLEPIVITQALPAHTATGSSSNWYRERLFCLLYSVLIAKSLVYFCGISLFSIY